MSAQAVVILNDRLKVETFSSPIIEYGVRWIKGQESSVVERVKRVNGELYIGADTNMEINIGTGDQNVHNSFDNVDIFSRKRVWVGDNEFVKVNKYFIKKDTIEESGEIYIYRWMCSQQLPGYYLPHAFIDPNNNQILDYYYIGAKRGWIDEEGKLRSVPGVVPTTRLDRSAYRSAARKNDGDGDNVDSNYHINDMRVYQDLIVTPMLIEFATRNFQSILSGFTYGRYTTSDLIAVTEANTNSVIVSDFTGSHFRVGQTIEIGTSRGGGQIAKDRIITLIESGVPEIDQSTIHFDGDPVDVSDGNCIYTISFKTGTTDGIAASIGYYEANDGKYPIVWRGLENPFGDAREHIDGIKISNWRAFVTLNPSDYDDASSTDGHYDLPYRPVAYLNASSSNGYVSELGYDPTYPFVELPTETSGSSSTGFADYYVQNSGDRTVMVAGSWYLGGGPGPFCWRLSSSLGYSFVTIGARLCKRP